MTFCPHPAITGESIRRVSPLFRNGTMGVMSRWPILRTWELPAEDGTDVEVDTENLAKIQACCMLGSAGLGKTFEMAHLADLERGRGLNVIEFNMGRMATSADALESRLTKITSKLRKHTAIYLDSLDEAMMPVRTTTNIVAAWIREDLKSKQPRLRISCRSAVWPTEVEAAIREVYPKENTRVAVLTPISDDNVRHVVKELGVDPGLFFRAVDGSGVSFLAHQPLTLQMLVRVFKEDGTLPKSRKQLFQKGIEQLAGERSERLERGTAATAAPWGSGARR